MKRHRGQPLPIDTKLKIVSELMQQRRERAALQATAGTRRRRRRTTTNQTSIARRHSVAQSTVSKINKLLTQLLLSREQSATAATAAPATTTTVAIASNGTAPTTTTFFNQGQSARRRSRIASGAKQAGRKRRPRCAVHRGAVRKRRATTQRLLSERTVSTRQAAIRRLRLCVDNARVPRAPRYLAQATRSTAASTGADGEERRVAQAVCSAMVRRRHLRSRRRQTRLVSPCGDPSLLLFDRSFVVVIIWLVGVDSQVACGDRCLRVCFCVRWLRLMTLVVRSITPIPFAL